MFRVHKRFFFRESSQFQSLFNSPAIPCPDPPGSSETNPVVFKEKDITSEAFGHLLWVFYNPQYSIYSATVDIWVQILTLAQKWGFREVESLCVRELEKLAIQPVDKICIYQRFKLDRTLLVESFAKLTARPEPLTLDEGGRLGLETSLQIAQARELSRGLRSGSRSSIQLQDSELHSVIRDVFKLEDEGFFDFATGTTPQPQEQQQQQQQQQQQPHLSSSSTDHANGHSNRKKNSRDGK